MTRHEEGTTLWEVWQASSDENRDGLRGLLEHVVQRVLEEELTAFLGAEAHERTSGRQGYRNGYKPRQLKTRVGRLELLVPKDREGRFQTALFERYQRSEKALLLSLAEMYVQGVSTRKVKKITEALCGLEISKSQVSALAQDLDAQLRLWRERSLEAAYPYLVVDARYEKVRRHRRVVSQGVLLVVGIRDDGFREILGAWCADSENESTWSEVFGDLKRRGLRGVEYVVSDDHEGLRRAVERYFQGAVWQRCQVHFVRNALRRVKPGDRKELAALMKQITHADTLQAAKEGLQRAIAALNERYPALAEWLDEQGEEMLAVYHLPPAHRKRMRSTNMLERLNQELKRRTRVVRIFPNEAACLRLVTALAVETSEEWMERRYLTMSPHETGSELTDAPAA